MEILFSRVIFLICNVLMPPLCSLSHSGYCQTAPKAHTLRFEGKVCLLVCTSHHIPQSCWTLANLNGSATGHNHLLSVSLSQTHLFPKILWLIHVGQSELRSQFLQQVLQATLHVHSHILLGFSTSASILPCVSPWQNSTYTEVNLCRVTKT